MRREDNVMQYLFMAAFRVMGGYALCGWARVCHRAGLPAVVLAGLLLLPMSAVQAASFDCATATAVDEKAICDNRSLNDQDVRMVTLYEVLTHMVAMGQRGDLQTAQKAWLKGRVQCKGDIACLRTAYESRIHTLQQALQDIYSRGPY